MVSGVLSVNYAFTLHLFNRLVRGTVLDPLMSQEFYTPPNASTQSKPQTLSGISLGQRH
ncbi:hypothetical protein [Coleofasciculus sp. H7-2]|uniref:hypothetical protein n=1 Tax=Coleofasciculus sp. H7-2 TaxID=3351545 RepID=UPI003670CBED